MFNGRVDTSIARSDLRRYAKVTSRTVNEVLRDEMRLGVQALVKSTYPRTKSKTTTAGSISAKKMGESALRRDLYKIFTVVQSKDTLEALDAEFGHRFSPLSFDYTVEEMGYYHERMRTKSGRPPKRYKAPVIKIGGKYHRQVPHVSAQQFEKYFNQRKKQVGRLKAGWKKAIIGTKGKAGAWVMRHSGSEGDYKDKLRALGGYLEAINSVPYNARNRRQMVVIWKGRERAISTKLKRALKHRIR